MNTRLTICSTMFSVIRACERPNHWNANVRGNFCPAFSFSETDYLFESRRNKSREIFTIHWIGDRNQLAINILAVLTCINYCNRAITLVEGWASRLNECSGDVSAAIKNRNLCLYARPVLLHHTGSSQEPDKPVAKRRSGFC